MSQISLNHSCSSVAGQSTQKWTQQIFSFIACSEARWNTHFTAVQFLESEEEIWKGGIVKKWSKCLRNELEWLDTRWYKINGLSEGFQLFLFSFANFQGIINGYKKIAAQNLLDIQNQASMRLFVNHYSLVTVLRSSPYPDEGICLRLSMS